MEKQASAGEFERLGGEEGIARWITRFYDRIPRHPLLSGLFSQDMEVSRAKQIAFMVEFFGGPPQYTERHGKAFLRYKHRHVSIGRPERDAWMELIMGCLREMVSDEALIAEVEERLAPLATAMINHHPEKKDAYFFN
jgi:hemoglobin